MGASARQRGQLQQQTLSSGEAGWVVVGLQFGEGCP
jgi:hypothetical protein